MNCFQMKRLSAGILLAVFVLHGCAVGGSDGSSGMSGLRTVNGDLISDLSADDSALAVVAVPGPDTLTADNWVFFLSDRSGTRQLYRSIRSAGERYYSQPQLLKPDGATALVSLAGAFIDGEKVILGCTLQSGSSILSLAADGTTNTVNTQSVAGVDKVALTLLPPGSRFPNLAVADNQLGMLYVTTNSSGAWLRMEAVVAGYSNGTINPTDSRVVRLPTPASAPLKGEPFNGGTAGGATVIPRAKSGLDSDLLLYSRRSRDGNWDLYLTDLAERELPLAAFNSGADEFSPQFYSGDERLYFACNGYAGDGVRLNLFVWDRKPLLPAVQQLIPEAAADYYRTLVLDWQLYNRDPLTVQARSGIPQWISAVSNSGYSFTGWNSAANGSGSSWQPGDEIPAGGITLYAQWQPLGTEVTVTFDGNGGTGSMQSQNFVIGYAASLAGNLYSMTGWQFAGWSTNTSGGEIHYTDGQQLVLTNDLTLYAQWQLLTNTLTLDMNGGNGTAVGAIAMGYTNQTNLPAVDWTNLGYRLAGWSSVPGGSVQYTNNAPFTMYETNVTLYAIWEHQHYFDMADGSADGLTLLAVESTNYNNAGCWVSRDGGETWNKTYSGAYTFTDCAVSSDGRYMVAVANEGISGKAVLISSDYGASWSDRSSGYGYDFTSKQLIAAAISDDGQTIYVSGASTMYIICSTDGGDSFSELYNSSPMIWTALACTPDGNTVVGTLLSTGTYAYYSTNTGSSFSSIYGPESNSGSVIFLSRDGQKMVFSGINVTNQCTTNGGDVWFAVQVPESSSPGEQLWNSISGVYSGDTLLKAYAAGVQETTSPGGDGMIYVSTDGTLAEWEQVAGCPPAVWTAVIPSADGSRLTAVSQDSGIYIVESADTASPVWRKVF